VWEDGKGLSTTHKMAMGINTSFLFYLVPVFNHFLLASWSHGMWQTRWSSCTQLLAERWHTYVVVKLVGPRSQLAALPRLSVRVLCAQNTSVTGGAVRNSDNWSRPHAHTVQGQSLRSYEWLNSQHYCCAENPMLIYGIITWCDWCLVCYECCCDYWASFSLGP
jgi:hypothetical protein